MRIIICWLAILVLSGILLSWHNQLPSKCAGKAAASESLLIPGIQGIIPD